VGVYTTLHEFLGRASLSHGLVTLGRVLDTTNKRIDKAVVQIVNEVDG
jgi:hypothetical protein